MSRGYAVVTGTSSGIGEASAHHLAGLGFNVFAGVRKQADAERVAGPRIEPVIIDVTDDASVAAAATQIGEAVGNSGLAGLVNNAGVAVAGPLEFIDLADVQQQLELNVTGVLRTTQAFLPQIRKARGRIVNISSIGGRVAVPLVGPYNASKFALEGMSNSLRSELRPWGMHVALIEPGPVATPTWDKGVAPQEVAEAVAHALTASKRKTRYVVGRDARMRAPMAKVLPDRVMDAANARALAERKADRR